MGMRNLEVIVTVTDKASRPLEQVSKKVKDTGRAAAQSEVDFTKFNKTLFTTAAFAGIFAKMFSTLTNSFDQGSELDRLSNQFERVLGPKGALFNTISNMTDNSIDKFETMRQGIALRSMGIVRSTEHLADIVSKAGTAAKLAGHDSGEGIKNFSEFLKDGNVSHLQFLNLISQTNPALQAQMAILSKVGGVMGGVISTQARLAMGQKLLDAATKGNLKGFRDLRDIISEAKQNFTLFKQETGRLLLTAFAPLIDIVSKFIYKMSLTIDHIRKNEKNLMFLVKAIGVTTMAALGLAGALGTLRLAAMALNSIGFGLPKMIVAIALLSAGFLGLTNRVEKFTDKIKLFASFVKGVYQLVTSLNTKTGIAQIDEDIAKLLEKNGLLEFAKNLGRGLSVVKAVTKDIVDAFKWAGKKIDDIFGGIGRKFIDTISRFKEPWDNWWVSESATPIEKFIRNFSVIGTSLGTIITGMLIKSITSKLAGGILSKIPLIGGMFGGSKSGGPKGTKSDPIYTKGTSDIKSSGSFIIPALGDAFNFIKMKFAQIFATFTIAGGGFQGLFAVISGVVKSAGPIIGGVLRTISSTLLRFVAPVMVFGSAIIGIVQGIYNTWDDWKSFFGGLFDLGKAFFTIFGDYLAKIIPGFETFISGVKWVADTLIKIPKMIMDGWRLIFELLGSVLGPLGAKMSKWARELSPETFKNEQIPANLNKTNQSTASTSGNKTEAVTIPTETENSSSSIDAIGEQMKTVSGDQRKQMQMSVEEALRSDSAAGSNFTQEELARIYGNSFHKALETSSVMKNIEKNTGSDTKSNIHSRRGP